MPLTLILLPERYAVCRFAPGTSMPAWALDGPFCSITRTTDELSVVCLDAAVPPEVQCEHGWRAIKFSGPFDFASVGILLAVAQPLADAGISIFAISTYDTDYILVRETQYEATIAVLQAHNHHLSSV
jgi:uncharacterized protein